jgi:hypothetical protein
MKDKEQQRDNQKTIFPLKIKILEQLIQDHFNNNLDLNLTVYQHQGSNIAIFYISYIVDTDKLQNLLLQPLLKRKRQWTNQLILNDVPLSKGTTTSSMQEILKKLISGDVFIYIEEETEIVSYPLLKMEQRSLAKAETESLVLGPQIAFTESLSSNMNVVRGIIKTPDLVMEKVVVGKRIPYEVRIIYLKSLANEIDVETMRQRIKNLDVDEIEDVAILKQYIEDSSTNIFPQFYTTELPDRFCYTITKGKIGVLGDNSPTGIIAPSTFLSFFESTEDIYMRWNAGSFLRLLRFIAMFIAIIITPAYVAVVTYQFELLPTKLLITIGKSRAQVPFPPIIEALLIEFMIELLREAGARLPTKVGQTMGIVGGLVIGEAAVQAGITSNILIIVVAMSALASFTAPSYLMGTSLRVIRFPLMILAALWGLVGIMFGICLLIIHLLRLTSLGRPYLAPIYPLQLQDFNKTLYRLPYSKQFRRAKIGQPQDMIRYPKEDAAKKRDIDE